MRRPQLINQDAFAGMSGVAEEVHWMIDLGYQITVYARGAYPFGAEPGSLKHLLGFNELQHQV